MKENKYSKILFSNVLLFIILSVSIQAQNITTVAGTGVAGYSGDGGLATAAKIYRPYMVVFDKNGNMYIADYINHCIRKVNASSGNISTIAGTGTSGYSGDGGPAVSAKLWDPSCIALDTSGNIYITDSGNHRIRKINSSGNITTVAGTGVAGYSGDGGPATSAKLNNSYWIIIDKSENIYISDFFNHCIRKITASTGNITTIAGMGTAGYSGDGGAATSAKLDQPIGLVLDTANNLYICDYNNHRVRKITVSTGIITTIAGTGTAGFSGDGGIATSADLNFPFGIAMDPAENIYIGDQYNHRIRKIISGSANITTIAGTGTGGYAGDGGLATLAQLNYPEGVTLDACGNLYIGDTNNDRIRKITGVYTPFLTADFTSNSVNICPGDPIVFTDQSIGSPTIWNWSFPGGIPSVSSASSVIVAYTVPGTYTISLTVANECGSNIKMGNITVYVDCHLNLKVPNIFSPNNDSKNDLFFIDGLDSFPGSKTVIYNRWGTKIFETSTVGKYWDGRLNNGSDAPNGVYYYVINVQKDNVQTGYLQLIR